jgi:hypothetical protein
MKNAPTIVGAFFFNVACYGAEMVSTTGAPLTSRWFPEAVSTTLRKNTIADPGSTANLPDAILVCAEVSFENPVPGSSDQRTFAFGADDGLAPIDSTHACVALTFSDTP